MIRICIRKRMPLKLKKRLRNKARIRKKVMGTEERPRLVVFRSHRHIYAQLVNDISGEVIAHASTLGVSIKERTGKIQLSGLVGQQMAQRAIEKNIKQVVFDRGGFIYHGRVEAVATAARQGGLVFLKERV